MAKLSLQCAEWSHEIVYVPGAVLPTWAWVLIVAGVILLSAGGCFLYKVVKGQQTVAKGQVGGGTSYQSLDVAQPSISSREKNTPGLKEIVTLRWNTSGAIDLYGCTY